MDLHETFICTLDLSSNLLLASIDKSIPRTEVCRRKILQYARMAPSWPQSGDDWCQAGMRALPLLVYDYRCNFFFRL